MALFPNHILKMEAINQVSKFLHSASPSTNSVPFAFSCLDTYSCSVSLLTVCTPRCTVRSRSSHEAKVSWSVRAKMRKSGGKRCFHSPVSETDGQGIAGPEIMSRNGRDTHRQTNARTHQRSSVCVHQTVLRVLENLRGPK